VHLRLSALKNKLNTAWRDAGSACRVPGRPCSTGTQTNVAAWTMLFCTSEQDVEAHVGLLTVLSAARQSEKFSSATGTLSPLRAAINSQ